MTLEQLLESKGLRTVDVASRARLSEATVKRAVGGKMPSDLALWAISVALEMDESDVRDAIKESAEGSAS